jgi:excisionase family DNA binding protein
VTPLRSLRSSTPGTSGGTSDPDRLLDVSEAAALLKVPRSFLYSQSRLGPKSSLPHVRIGRYLRFVRADLVKWVESQRQGGTP